MVNYSDHFSYSGFTTDDDVNEDANLAIDATEAALSAVQDVHREMADFSRYAIYFVLNYTATINHSIDFERNRENYYAV